ncbi:MAG: hypothetical protein PHV61_10355 [Limnochordia bacterium]|nr:hypothetical protein [Limnochordia bacterium]MDD2630543.1 hypothetical protein [Limnochordia bacterium]
MSVLVVVEPQGSSDIEVNELMFLYFTEVYIALKCKVFPIAIFLKRREEEPGTFVKTLPFLDFNIYEFHYKQLYLGNLSWKDYINSSSPIGAALMSKMDSTEEEKVQVKIEFTRMVSSMQLDPARRSLLIEFFETHVWLNAPQTREYEEQIAILNLNRL